MTKDKLTVEFAPLEVLAVAMGLRLLGQVGMLKEEVASASSTVQAALEGKIAVMDAAKEAAK